MWPKCTGKANLTICTWLLGYTTSRVSAILERYQPWGEPTDSGSHVAVRQLVPLAIEVAGPLILRFLLVCVCVWKEKGKIWLIKMRVCGLQSLLVVEIGLRTS